MSRKQPSNPARLMAVPPAPKPPHRPDLSWLRWELEHNRSRAAKVLADFGTRLAADPLGAFGWGDAAVEAAAESDVAASLLRAVADEKVIATFPSFDAVLAELEADLTREVFAVARSPHRSTSTMSNAAAAAKGIAQARAVEMLRGFRKAIATADRWDREHPAEQTEARPVPTAGWAAVAAAPCSCGTPTCIHRPIAPVAPVGGAS